MNAAVSGRMGVALVTEGERMYSLHVDAPDVEVPRTPGDIPYLFGDATDVEFLEGVDVPTVREGLLTAAVREESLSLFLIGLDDTLSWEARAEAVSALDVLLVGDDPDDPDLTPELSDAAWTHLRNVLFARPLPATADVFGLRRICKAASAPGVLRLIRELEAAREAIHDVDLAWSAIPDAAFGDVDRHRERVRLVRDGGFYSLVRSLVEYGVVSGAAPFPADTPVREEWLARMREVRKPPVLDAEYYKALLLKHLGWIDKVAAIACSKQGVWGAEAEDFAAWVKLRLTENDYAALRKYSGEAEIKTYLATVVVRYFHNYARERWGRWRPSAAAERLGPPARDLEALVYRDGYRLDQAGEILRTVGRTRLTDAELARLLAQLPPREPLRRVALVSEPAINAAKGTSGADDRVADAEFEAQRKEIMGALARALERLDPEEQMIVRLHFADGLSVGDVARVLRLEQKSLYRRLEKVRLRVRAYLESDGVSGTDVRRLLWEEEEQVEQAIQAAS